MGKKFLKHKPSSITVAGIYIRHLARELRVEEELVARLMDTLPRPGDELLCIEAGLEQLDARMGDTEMWGKVDELAGQELGGQVATTLGTSGAIVTIVRATKPVV
jgi:hypothetical protein